MPKNLPSLSAARSFVRLGLLTAGVAAAFPITTHAALVTNGGFENPTVAAGTYAHTLPTGWSWLNPSAPGFLFSTSVGGIWPAAQEGVQYVDIGNSAASSFGITQTVSVPATGPYLLTWYDSTAHPVSGTSPYRVSIGSSTADYDAAHNAAPSLWQAQSLSVWLTAGDNTLTFAAQNASGGYDSLIDSVALTAVVPEPTTLVAGALGLVPLLLAGLRSRRTAP